MFSEVAEEKDRDEKVVNGQVLGIPISVSIFIESKKLFCLIYRFQ